MLAWGEWRRFWRKRMPILDWLPRYDVRRDLKFDVIAGVTVAVMLVPQEMSLAGMMGVPAQYGLYTAAAAPFLYPLFGSSRALSVANAAEGSLLVGVMLRAAEITSMEERVATGILLTFLSGLLMVTCGCLHQGGIVSFFSRTSMNGYIAATAVLIVTSQMPAWLGITLESRRGLTLLTWLEILAHVGETNVVSLGLGIFSMGLLSACKVVKAQLDRVVCQQHEHAPEEEGGYGSGDGDNDNDVTDANEDHEPLDTVDVQLHTTEVDPQRLHSKVAGNWTTAVTPIVTTVPSRLRDVAGSRRLLGATSSSSTGTRANSSGRLQGLLRHRPFALFACKLACDAGALVVCVIGMAVGAYVGEDRLTLTGPVHRGLPAPILPLAAVGGLIPWDRLQAILANAGMLSVVMFMSSVAAGSQLANKDGYEISPNQELLGLGFANLGASFFQGMPSSAGMSRSAVASQSAHTPLASMITALLVVLTLLFLTGPLYYLPQAPLAAIIILSAVNLVSFAEPRWLRRVRPQEVPVWVAAFLGTLTCGLLQGLFISAVASQLAIMARSKKPRVFSLGQRPDDGAFVDVEGGLGATELPDVVLVRMEHAMYFGNASHLIHALERKLCAAKERGRMLGVVVDCSRINDIDAPSIHALKEYNHKLHQREQLVLFANARRETAESLIAGGLWDDSDNAPRRRTKNPIDAALLMGDLQQAVEFLRCVGGGGGGGGGSSP